MSMRDRRSASAMSPSLRFLGFLNHHQQPADDADGQELELDERDVVWSSSSSNSYSPSSLASSPSPTPSTGGTSHRWPLSSSSRAFPSGSAGLSALLADDDDDSVSQYHSPATEAIPAAARRDHPKHQMRPQPHHQSAPVAVPAWSKAAAADRRRREAQQDQADAEEEEDGEDESVVPPHEMAARRAAAAASMMEGAGRTLKGRDLRRVRNAVWRTTGFLDDL